MVRLTNCGAVLFVLCTTAGCGPSMQSIYEGDVRFEHCYRLDLDRNIAPSHRHACWKQWVEQYSYGQTRDKLEYAKRRLRYLESGETSPPELNVASAQATAPNVHAPPPALAPQEPQVKKALTPAPQPASLPGQACALTCGNVFRDCLAPCAGAGAENPSQCVGCEQDYGRCMRRCYE